MNTPQTYYIKTIVVASFKKGCRAKLLQVNRNPDQKIGIVIL